MNRRTRRAEAAGRTRRANWLTVQQAVRLDTRGRGCLAYAMLAARTFASEGITEKRGQLAVWNHKRSDSDEP